MKRKFAEVLKHLFVDKYNCIICDRELPAPTPHRTCNVCYHKLEIIVDGFCLKCGKKLYGEGEYCLDCQEHEKHFDRAVAPVCYSGAAMRTVQELKYENRRYLAEPLARYMTDRFLSEELSVDLIIPVPLHEKRLKERGYNQSELLAAEISRALGVPMDASVALRVKDTLPSTQLQGRKAREENIEGAFVLKTKDAVKNKIVLVVDDVLTTGATSGELSRVLKKAGAAAVYVLTFATTREKPPVERQESN